MPRSRLFPKKRQARARGGGAFKFLHGRDFPIFEISTSYRPFAEAVGLKLGFKKERIFVRLSSTWTATACLEAGN